MSTTAVPAPQAAPVPQRVVRAWTFWDFGQQAFNTVILTFVYATYIAGLAADKDHGTAVISSAQTWAGLLIALLAPALGSLGDRIRNARLPLIVTTAATIAAMAALWFVEPSESFLLYGAVMLAVASVFSELAGVFYNSILLRISTPQTYGRISGTAWGMGYIGGVLVLVIALFGFVLDGGMLGISTDGALNIRAIALLCAGWFLVFGLPLLLLAPKDSASAARAGRWSLLDAYRDVVRRLVRMWREDRRLLMFFVASAVYRDGLGAVFAFAGILAQQAYGFSTEGVIYFGLAANLVAGIGTWLAGRIDDRRGPRMVIIASLSVMLVLGIAIIVSAAALTFWICGLAIAALVGPVQSASRSLLARLSSAETAGEDFGLFATTGRAVSFLSPALFTLFVALTHDSRLGIVGIVIVLALGLLLFLPLKFDHPAPESAT